MDARTQWLFAAATTWLLGLTTVVASAQPDLRDSSFEDLASITITTVGRKPQRYLTTPAAIHVLARDDLHSTGGDSVIDALRLAPGMHVGRIDAHSWAVAARGFNSLFSDKLVVLVDNRSVYTPLWSGIYWEQHEWLADELERIEVVRGPGGSKWGSNAVNGALNIFTPSARETQGLVAKGAIGDETRALGAIRYGTRIGEHGWVRGYLGYKDYDDSRYTTGGDAGDGWDMARGGFRYDGEVGDGEVMLQGAVFSGDVRQRIAVPTLQPPFVGSIRPGKSDGAHLHGTWSHRAERSGEIIVQAFYDRSERNVLSSNETRDTFDLEVQQQRALRARHELTWGAGFRSSRDEVMNDLVVSLDPSRETLNLWSAFIEDEISAREMDAALTLGAKIEHNALTGWEVQPSVRFVWNPDAAQTFWTAISRAVRRPSRINADLIATNTVLPAGALGPGSPPTLIQNIGNSDLESETLVAYEGGWRVTHADYALDVAAFYNEYDDLMGFGAATLDTSTLAPQFWRLYSRPENLGSGQSYGVEISGHWRATPIWSMYGAYTWFNLHLAPSSNRQLARFEGSSPRHTLAVRSSSVIASNWRLDMTVRYVDDLPALDVSDYIAADLSIARSLSDSLELALVGRNLLEDSHEEFRATAIQRPTEVERSAFVRVLWRTE